MYSLKIWTNPSRPDDVRVYIHGTTRSAVYFKLSSKGTVVWSSKTNDTPTKFRTGDHYGKIDKDGRAAEEVAEAFNITLGDKSSVEDWQRVLQLAADGIEIEG